MAVIRERGDVSIECDSCDERFTIYSDDFGDTWNAAKRDGWVIAKIGKDWIHGCPDCGV